MRWVASGTKQIRSSPYRFCASSAIRSAPDELGRTSPEHAYLLRCLLFLILGMLPVWIALEVWFACYLLVRRLAGQLHRSDFIFVRGVALGPLPAAVCVLASSSSATHRSLLVTGFLAAVRQPFCFQPRNPLVMPFRKYSESVTISTVAALFQPFQAFIAAASSMRLLVV